MSWSPALTGSGVMPAISVGAALSTSTLAVAVAAAETLLALSWTRSTIGVWSGTPALTVAVTVTDPDMPTPSGPRLHVTLRVAGS